MKTFDFFIEQDGFRGQLFEPEQKQDKVIIVFMGGEGKIISAGLLAEKIASYGYAALAVQLSDEKACIPIEKIKGRILLLAGTRDESWNSVYSTEFLKARLDKNRFSFPYKTCVYDGSHYIGIIPDMKKYKALNLIKLMSKEERKNKKQCDIARTVSEQEIIKWLKEW